LLMIGNKGIRFPGQGQEDFRAGLGAEEHGL
jgi:hypothetical protein